MDRADVISMTLGETTRTVWGLCPVCQNWQLEAPTDEHPLVLEIIFLEHDLEDHPGELLKLAQGQRIRAAGGSFAPMADPPPMGDPAADGILYG